MAYGSFKNGSLLESFSTIITSGGTAALLFNSDAYQLLTGSSSHIVTLPNATGMIVNQRFEMLNVSTGTITVKDFAGTTVGTLTTGQSKQFRITDISSSAGVWDVQAVGAGGAVGLSSTESAQFQALAASSVSSQSKKLKYNPEEISSNSWLTRGTLSAAKDTMASFALNGYFFSFGGRVSSTNQVITERFSDDTGIFLRRGDMVTARRASQGMASSKGYCVGGFTSVVVNNVESYNDATDIWANVAVLPTPKGSSAGAFIDGYGYAAGGFTGSNTGLNDNVAYNETANAWYPRASNSIARYRSGGLLSLSALYLAGGSTTGGNAIASVEVYKSVSNSFTTLQNAMPGNKDYATSFANLGFGYMTSGSDGITNVVATNFKLNFATNAWSNDVASMTVGRYDAANSGVALNGLGYSVGGTNSGNAQTATVEAYASYSLFNLGILTRSTSIPASLAVAAVLNALSPNVPVQVRTGGNEWKTFISGASPLKQGEALATKFTESHEMMSCGGGSPQIASTEIHNPTTLTWLIKTSMITARGGGFHFPIDGYGYCGAAGASPFTLNERYNISLDSWASRTAIPVARDRTQSHTLNGFGYVYSTSGTVTNNQYKYNATLDSWSLPASNYGVGANGYALGYALLGYGYIIGGDDGAGATFNQNLQYSDVADTFTNKTNVHNVQQGGCVAFEGLGYVVGGYNGGNITTVAAYNQATNTWAAKASLVTATSANSSDFEDGGIYSMGGGTSPTSNFKLNPYSNVWSSSLTAMNFGSYFPLICMPGFYRAYEVRVGVPAFYAGLGGGVWTSATNMTTNHNVGAGLSINGYGYVIGGFIAGGSQTAQVDRYDGVTDSWLQSVSNSNALYSIAAFTLAGRGHRVTGQTAGGPHEAFNPVLVAWATLAAGPGVADWAQGSSIDDRGYVLGGSGVNTAQYYKNSTNAWLTVTGPGTGLTSARWSQGGFIFAAGADAPSTSVQKYNHVLDSWGAAASMNVARRNYTSVFNGQAVMAGSATSFVSSTESYNDAGNFWTLGANLVLGVGNTQTFTLQDATYVAGGWTGSSVLNTQRLSAGLKNAVLSAGLSIA